MAEMIAVKPARKGMGLSHPVAGVLRDDGGEWPADQFTFRRLEDKDVKRVKADDEAETDAKDEPAKEPVTDAAPASDGAPASVATTTTASSDAPSRSPRR